MLFLSQLRELKTHNFKFVPVTVQSHKNAFYQNSLLLSTDVVSSAWIISTNCSLCFPIDFYFPFLHTSGITMFKSFLQSGSLPIITKKCIISLIVPTNLGTKFNKIIRVMAIKVQGRRELSFFFDTCNNFSNCTTESYRCRTALSLINMHLNYLLLELKKTLLKHFLAFPRYLIILRDKVFYSINVHYRPGQNIHSNVKKCKIRFLITGTLASISSFWRHFLTLL